MQATTRALDHLLRAVGDPVTDLRDVVRGHPEFDPAQCLRAGIGVLAKTSDSLAAIACAIATTDRMAASHRTRAHLAAAEAWLSGQPQLAADRYASILRSSPFDLLALRLAQSCYFFVGRLDELCALTDAVMTTWPEGRRGFEFVLAMASFAHAENGDTDYAEALGRKALANDSACPFGVHAVAHAFVESGRHREGATWMRHQRAHWARESRMLTHNAWHLAMFDVEQGNVGSAVEILDRWLLPAGELSQIDACDAVTLLWRLSVEGVGDNGRWGRISDAFERTMTPGFWAYVDLHAALAHIMADMRERGRRLKQGIARCANGRDYAAFRARNFTQPVLRALDAWADGRDEEARVQFATLRPVLERVGGSRVQLEAFASIEQGVRKRPEARSCDRSTPVDAKPAKTLRFAEQQQRIVEIADEASGVIEEEARLSMWCA